MHCSIIFMLVFMPFYRAWRKRQLCSMMLVDCLYLPSFRFYFQPTNITTYSLHLFKLHYLYKHTLLPFLFQYSIQPTVPGPYYLPPDLLRQHCKLAIKHLPNCPIFLNLLLKSNIHTLFFGVYIYHLYRLFYIGYLKIHVHLCFFVVYSLFWTSLTTGSCVFIALYSNLYISIPT